MTSVKTIPTLTPVRTSRNVDDSETEQDDISSNTDDDEYEDNEYFMAYKRKNRKVIDFWKWKKTSFIKRKKVSRNILVKLPGVVGKAKSLKKVMETWSYLIDNGIINDIVKFTNQYIVNLQGEFSKERDVRITDEVEIRGFIGLLYLLGIYHASRLNLNEIWDSNGGGIEKFRMTMSQKRFQFLMHSLRFDDRDSRSERRSVAPVRTIFEKFVENCQQNYSLGANVTIDEMLVGFPGRCSFKQYIPSKPKKYGIKIFSMIDAKLFYIYNMEIYAGKAQDTQ
ncbi:piggyBac transposable element-derived protein 4-like [Odontomachus brunneus]|uniref:piggyBac transposable element-derived protein 4-like n=1 Tax=Odontomachus brunneus TaxID=486640 RepID=UPI0013F1D9DD|nr:piggyBac transposable element-derived protein 4-like [Odontomachus brunneus]